MTLKSLAEKYCCDKLYAHSYIDGFYEEAFRGREVRHFLEIGIGFADLMAPFVPQYIHGCSLFMWRDYFPEAEIYSCDIRPETLVNEGRVHSIVADQSKTEDLVKVLEMAAGGFDIVIDDGSHQPDHQIFAARFFLPTMTRNSLYIVEDCQSPDKIVEALGEGEILRFDKRPDDCLVVFMR